MESCSALWATRGSELTLELIMKNVTGKSVFWGGKPKPNQNIWAEIFISLVWREKRGSSPQSGLYSKGPVHQPPNFTIVQCRALAHYYHYYLSRSAWPWLAAAGARWPCQERPDTRTRWTSPAPHSPRTGGTRLGNKWLLKGCWNFLTKNKLAGQF